MVKHVTRVALSTDKLTSLHKQAGAEMEKAVDQFLADPVFRESDRAKLAAIRDVLIHEFDGLWHLAVYNKPRAARTTSHEPAGNLGALFERLETTKLYARETFASMPALTEIPVLLRDDHDHVKNADTVLLGYYEHFCDHLQQSLQQELSRAPRSV